MIITSETETRSQIDPDLIEGIVQAFRENTPLREEVAEALARFLAGGGAVGA